MDFVGIVLQYGFVGIVLHTVRIVLQIAFRPYFYRYNLAIHRQKTTLHQRKSRLSHRLYNPHKLLYLFVVFFCLFDPRLSPLCLKTKNFLVGIQKVYNTFGGPTGNAPGRTPHMGSCTQTIRHPHRCSP